MDVQLKKQCRSVLTYSTLATLDYSGSHSIASTATVSCRIESRTREIPVGNSVIEERTDHFVIIPETFTLSRTEATAAYYMLPFDTEYRRAKIVSFFDDENGVFSHVEMVF